MLDDLPEPSELRGKAIVARLRAQGITDPDEERRAFLVLADEYELLAKAIEQERKGGAPPGAAD